jgi:hypothetical protein
MASDEGGTGSDLLTARERAFVEQFLLTANGARAAEAAGYAPKSAKVRATRLMNRPRVMAAIYEIDPVAGTVRLSPDAPPRAMRAIASIKHRVTAGAKGNVHEIEVRLWDKPSMLRLAGRHVGIAGFVDRLELTGKHGNAIELERRVTEVSDDELKARVAELIAKL